MKRALQIILALSLFGTLFSGYLSYQELFPGGVTACPAVGTPGTVFGYPACVYGFFMFLAVAITSAAGLLAAHRDVRHAGPAAPGEAHP